MIEQQVLTDKLNRWVDRFEKAVCMHNYEEMSEASRMVASICSVLRASYPDGFTNEIREKVHTLFNNAVSTVIDDQQNHQDSTRFYELYERNISKRLESLKELEKSMT